MKYLQPILFVFVTLLSVILSILSMPLPETATTGPATASSTTPTPCTHWKMIECVHGATDRSVNVTMDYVALQEVTVADTVDTSGEHWWQSWLCLGLLVAGCALLGIPLLCCLHHEAKDAMRRRVARHHRALQLELHNMPGYDPKRHGPKPYDVFADFEPPRRRVASWNGFRGCDQYNSLFSWHEAPAKIKSRR